MIDKAVNEPAPLSEEELTQFTVDLPGRLIEMAERLDVRAWHDHRESVRLSEEAATLMEGAEARRDRAAALRRAAVDLRAGREVRAGEHGRPDPDTLMRPAASVD